MKRRVGIVGTGWVGTSVAISTLHAGVAEELLLDDLRTEVAEGEAMDLQHGQSFYPSCRVRTASLEEMADCQVLVVPAGLAGSADQTRLELLRENAVIMRSLGERLRAVDFGGVIVMVTNPVDVLTRVILEASGLPPERVIGTGTMLETARLRQMVGERIGIHPRSVHAQMIGEHGDSSVAIWSAARIGGRPLRDWSGWDRETEEQLSATVRGAAYEIIRRKGATNHAIGLVTANLLSALLRDERRVLTVSRLHEQVTGLEDVCLSLPAIVGAGGAAEVVHPALDEAEQAGLYRSASILSEAFASVSST